MHGLIFLFVCLSDLSLDPPIEDLDRFPCWWVAQANLDFADTFIDRCKLQASIDLARADLFSCAQHETTRLRLPWMWLVQAHEKGLRFEKERRAALGKIRWAVGDEAYRTGCLPPPVPLWRFGRLP